jgi:hypothetical protein
MPDSQPRIVLPFGGYVQRPPLTEAEAWHVPCGCLVIDTETRRTAWDHGSTPFGWCEGNLSCDCNRADALGVDWDFTGTCYGCERFLVIACTFPGVTFDELNSGYPQELRDRFRQSWQQPG